MIIGLGKPKRLNKSPWEYRIRMGRGRPRKGNEPRMPKEEKWAKEARKQWNGSRKPEVA